MTTSKSNANNLLSTAAAEGSISPQAYKALTVEDLGAQIQAGLGIIDVDNVHASSVVLVTVQPDDSGSIRFAGHTAVLRDGHNIVIDALTGSKQNDAVLFGTRYLNGFVLNPYCPIAQAVRMDSTNYDPNMGTPLYDNAVLLLATVLAKAQEFSNNGVPVRTVTLIVSDGADVHSTKQTPKSVASVVKDMLASENHIVAAMGIDDEVTDFYQVFSGRSCREVESARKAGTLEQLEPADGGMGIWPRWVLTPGDSPSEIRKAFQVFSQSAVRVSQAGNNFSKTAMGGFGA